MLCFSPHHRVDGRSKTLRPGERLVPLGTRGKHLQQTRAAEEPEGGATGEECQAAGLLQEIRLCLDLYSLPAMGKPRLFYRASEEMPLRRA